MQTKLLLVLAIAIGAFAISALPAGAWYTKLRPGQAPTHFLLAQLSSEAMIHFNVYDQRAVYSGSNEPDDHGLQDHTASARRSYQSWDAAARECAQNKRDWAARRLARSFHYLQDYGDPTDYLGGGRKGYVRQMAHDMLTQGSRVKGNTHWRRAYDQFYGQVARMSMKATLDYAHREARQLGDRINGVYEQWYSHGGHDNQIPYRDRLIQSELLVVFGLLAACQNRAVELFAVRCRELAGGPPMEANPRPPINQPSGGFSSEATPRPSVQR